MITAIRVGRYEIVDELGRGAMGVVYRAKDPSIGRMVAVQNDAVAKIVDGLLRRTGSGAGELAMR